MLRTGHEELYKIIRFKFNGNNRTMETGLTLEEARDHCKRDDTHAKKDKNGHRAWFDGYTKES